MKARVDSRSPGFFCFVLLLAIMLVTCSETRAQEDLPVDKVRIHGMSAFTEAEAQRSFVTRPGAIFQRTVFESDLEGLASKLRREGYSSARIDSITTDSLQAPRRLTLHLWIHEGKRALIESIDVVGDPDDVRDIDGFLIDSQPGNEFNPRLLEGDIERILRGLERDGYALAAASIANIRYHHTGAETGAIISIRVHRGPRIRLHGLRITGNTRTKGHVIVREARIPEHQVFDAEIPRLIKRRLERLRLFSAVSLPVIFLRPDSSAGLLVEVQEGNPNHFDGVIGYVPASGAGQKGFFTGLVDVKFWNLFGTGRKLAVRWYRQDDFSQEIELRYLEPWIASMPINGEIHLAQRFQDSTYVRRQYGLDLGLMLSPELSVSIAATQTEVVAAEQWRHLVGDGTELFLGASLLYDSRDDPLTPQEGALYRTSYELGRKSFQHPGSPVTRSWSDRITLDLEYYVSPIARQVVMLALHGRDYRAPRIGVSDLFRLGGTSTLRGYRESQFLGSRMAWVNLEYRWLVGGRSYVAGIIDGGYMFSPESPGSGVSRLELTRLGYGISLRLDSPLGLISVGLAFGRGDSFSTAKLHFRLINEF